MLQRFGISIRLILAGLSLTAVSAGWSMASENVQVPLTTQGAGQQGHCDGSGSPVGDCRGFVNAHLSEDGRSVLLNVHLRDAQPNTTYEVFIRCVRKIGALKTDCEGDGDATIRVDAAGLPTPFAVDLNLVSPPFDNTTTTPIVFQ